MSKVGQKIRALIFVLFTLKWTKVKDLDEIKKCRVKVPSFTLINAQFSNINQQKVSSLSQIHNVKDIFNDLGSIASSKTSFKASSQAKFDKKIG